MHAEVAEFPRTFIEHGEVKLLSDHLASVVIKSPAPEPFNAYLFNLLLYAILHPNKNNRKLIINTLARKLQEELLKAKCNGDTIAPPLDACVDGCCIDGIGGPDNIYHKIITIAYDVISSSYPEATTKGHTPLTLAVSYGDFEATKTLMEYTYGSDTTLLTTLLKNGASALYIACEGGYLDIAQYFIDNFTEVTKQLLYKPKANGWTCLGIAALNRHTPIVNFLVKHAPKLVNRPNDAHTALHLAADAGYTEIVRILLEKGADLRALTTKHTAGNYHRLNSTALFLAADQGHLETVKTLIKWHSRKVIPLDTPNSCNIRPWQIAIARGYDEICKELNPPELSLLGYELSQLREAEHPVCGYDKTFAPLHPVHEINEHKIIIAILNLFKDERFFIDRKLTAAGTKLLDLLKPYVSTIRFDRIKLARVFDPIKPITQQPNTPVYPICRAAHLLDARDWIAGRHAYDDDEHPDYRKNFIEAFSTHVTKTPEDITFSRLSTIHKKLIRDCQTSDKERYSFRVALGSSADNLGMKEINKFIEKNPERTIGTQTIGTPYDQNDNCSITVITGLLMDSNRDTSKRLASRPKVEARVTKAITTYHASVKKDCQDFDYTNNPDLVQYNAFLGHIVELCCTIDRLHPFSDANIRTILVGVLYPECCKRNIPVPIMFDPNRFDGTSKSKLIQDIKDGVMLEKELQDEEKKRGRYLDDQETYEWLADRVTELNDPGPWTGNFFRANNHENQMTKSFNDTLQRWHRLYDLISQPAAQDHKAIKIA